MLSKAALTARQAEREHLERAAGPVEIEIVAPVWGGDAVDRFADYLQTQPAPVYWQPERVVIPAQPDAVLENEAPAPKRVVLHVAKPRRDEGITPNHIYVATACFFILLVLSLWWQAL